MFMGFLILRIPQVVTAFVLADLLLLLKMFSLSDNLLYWKVK